LSDILSGWVILTSQDQLHEEGFLFWRWDVAEALQDAVKVSEMRSEIFSCFRGERGENSFDVIFL
jgi:hypothetical protein